LPIGHEIAVERDETKVVKAFGVFDVLININCRTKELRNDISIYVCSAV
jgi:hypothetical protein